MKTYNNIELLRETEKAILVKIEGREFWAPKSACTINADTIEVEDWKAREIDAKLNGNARTNAMFANMKRDIEAARASETAEAKAEREALEAHNSFFCHRDSRRGEYYGIANGRRFNA